MARQDELKKQVICSYCGWVGHYKTFCPRKPNKPIKVNKRPRQIGKGTIKYNAWRDGVAKPYLDKTFGHTCKDCGLGGELDVCHFETRGGHANKKMQLSNVYYLHRACHQKEHGQL